MLCVWCLFIVCRNWRVLLFQCKFSHPHNLFWAIQVHCFLFCKAWNLSWYSAVATHITVFLD